MTEQHPLTQKMVWKLVENVAQTTDWNNCDEYEDVLYARAAADWQLEQVIRFLEVNKDLSVETALRFIRPVMRPQQQEDK